jgi:antitoxin HicB
LEADRVLFRIPLLFSPQPEGGVTVTSPVLPELITEGRSLAETFANAQDALATVIEFYTEASRSLSASVILPANGEVICSDPIVEAI